MCIVEMRDTFTQGRNVIINAEYVGIVSKLTLMEVYINLVGFTIGSLFDNCGSKR